MEITNTEEKADATARRLSISSQNRDATSPAVITGVQGITGLEDGQTAEIADDDTPHETAATFQTFQQSVGDSHNSVTERENNRVDYACVEPANSQGAVGSLLHEEVDRKSEASETLSLDRDGQTQEKIDTIEVGTVVGISIVSEEDRGALGPVGGSRRGSYAKRTRARDAEGTSRQTKRPRMENDGHGDDVEWNSESVEVLGGEERDADIGDERVVTDGESLSGEVEVPDEADQEAKEEVEAEAEPESEPQTKNEERTDGSDQDDDWEVQKALLLARRASRRKRIKVQREMSPKSSATASQSSLPLWCTEPSEFRIGALTRAIKLHKVELVEAFVKSSFAYTVINDRDRQDHSPLSVAFLRGTPEILALLLSVKAPEEEAGGVSLADIEAALGVENQLPIEDEELQRVDINERYLNEVPLIHLLLRKRLGEDSLLILGCLLYYRLDAALHQKPHAKAGPLTGVNLETTPAEQSEYPVDGNESLEEVPWLAELSTLENKVSQFLERFPPLNLQVLEEVNLDAPDYYGATLLWRFAASGADAHCRLLLACGADFKACTADGVTCLEAAISSQSIETVNAFLEWARYKHIPLPSTLQLIQECTQSAAWNVLFDIVRSNPEITSEEFELVAQHSDNLGYGEEFLETFRRAIDEDFDENTNGELEQFLITSSRCRTVLITHSDCLQHLNAPEPNDFGAKPTDWQALYPENVTRLEVLLDESEGILKTPKFEPYPWLTNLPLASLADILRVHDAGYIQMIQNKCAAAHRAMASSSVTSPFVPIKLDDDTGVTPLSWEAARAAAGCVIGAVQAVCEGAYKNAFCAIRPPGHHVGTYGAAQPPNDGRPEGVSVMALDTAVGSLGFCLLNNVAIGAAYGLYNYKNIKKIAIIDFDIHHGNGTEQIVRHLAKKTRRVTMRSSTEWGTSLESVLEIPYYKIWRDSDDASNVMFVSVHGFDGSFYPATGYDCDDENPRIINVTLDADSSTNSIRDVFDDRVAPALMEFHPDLVMVSAGFDGHAYDGLGVGFSKCHESDFAYVTRVLQVVANLCCEGRLVSVLEGGYNTALGVCSPFARSVAAHVDALNRTAPRSIFPQQLTRAKAMTSGQFQAVLS